MYTHFRVRTPSYGLILIVFRSRPCCSDNARCCVRRTVSIITALMPRCFPMKLHVCCSFCGESADYWQQRLCVVICVYWKLFISYGNNFVVTRRRWFVLLCAHARCFYRKEILFMKCRQLAWHSSVNITAVLLLQNKLGLSIQLAFLYSLGRELLYWDIFTDLCDEIQFDTCWHRRECVSLLWC